ncbi:MAG: response regulator [Thermodesulfobacteriota bacterium]
MNPSGPDTTLRVLMVDQSAQACAHVRQLLAERLPTLEFAPCHCPGQTFDLAGRFSPTVVIQELTFPEGDGFELLKGLRRNPQTCNTPVLVLTRGCAEAAKNRCFLLGASDVLDKDGDSEEFIARVLHHGRRAAELGKLASRGVTTVSLPAKHIIKLVMIDPSRAACMMVAKGLQERDEAEFTPCHDPARALEIVDTAMPTVIVQSLSPGDMDGFSLLRTLRENPASRDIPIIILSSTSDVHQKVAALESGANDYVVKSANVEEVLRRVRHHSSEYFNLLKLRFAAGKGKGDEGKKALRVLMVDDSRAICFAIGKMLESEPEIVFEFVTAAMAAADRARAFRPTVILQDMEMPDRSGIDLLREYREDPLLGDVPVIILSGTTAAAAKARAFAGGANDYVEKDMDRIELISRIRYHSSAYLNRLQLDANIQVLLEAQKRLELRGQFIKKTFGRYLSDKVVQSLLDTPEGLELGGENRNISILMADLRGFTSLSENLPPQTVLSMINIFLQVMTEIILRHNGTIDEFIGDAILAMFGAPEHREDDARRAVACAIAMQLAMEGVNRRNRQEGYPAVAMGIGINTGEVIVGNIGSEMRSKYGVVGKNVNLTSRIESYTVGGQILASASTVAACGPILRIDGEMTVMPKGVKEPVTIYEIGGIGGDYHLFLPEKKEAVLRRLVKPQPVTFRILDGKDAGGSSHSGTIVAYAGNEAELTGEALLAALQNLRLSLDGTGLAECGELYGKVIRAGGPVSRIIFTYLPEKAANHLDNLLSGEEGACN